MYTKKLIPVDEFCINHNIDTSFINTLQDNGMIKITTLKKNLFFDAGQLLKLEKIICFYYELDINIEGIESISHLLERIEILQNEISDLRNRILFYETSMLDQDITDNDSNGMQPTSDFIKIINSR